MMHSLYSPFLLSRCRFQIRLQLLQRLLRGRQGEGLVEHHVRHHQQLLVHIYSIDVRAIDDQLLADADEPVRLLAQLPFQQFLAVGQVHGEHMLRLIV